MMNVTGAAWLAKPSIPLNPGLVAVIGARGSGKTALADLVAAGGLALSPHMRKESFVTRAQEHLTECSVQLAWENGETTGNEVIHAEMDDLMDEPHVQYLSQQFVAELCNAEDTNNPLNAEIERVIFNAHPRDDRLGASSFAELLELQLEGSHQKRRRHQETLRKASNDLTAERVRKAGLTALVKERDDKDKALQQDKRDRTLLIPKGNEERAKRLELVTQAAEHRRQLVERAQRRVQTLMHLESDVADFRDRRAPELLGEMQKERQDTGLSADEWNLLNVDFVGDVDSLLKARKADARALVGRLQGPADSDPAVRPDADPTVPLIADDADLSKQTLSLLEREVARLNQLVGADQNKVKRYAALTDKINKAETSLGKIDEQIKRAREADEKIDALIQLGVASENGK